MPSFSALTTGVKYLLFFFNLLFVITGIIIISVGAAVQAQFKGYISILDEPFRSVPAFLIAIGVLIFIIAFFGCCGAIKENYCMILTFAILMIVIFIFELSAGIAGFVLRDKTYATVSGNLHSTMKDYKTSDPAKYIWDELQRDFQCCGTERPDDWKPFFNESLPMSCCPPVLGAIGESTCTLAITNYYKVGCAPGLANFLASHAGSLGAAGLCVGIVQTILTYGIIGWGDLAKTTLFPVATAQKSLLRVICRKLYRYPSNELFLEFGVLDVRQFYFVGILFSCHLAKRTKYENGA